MAGADSDDQHDGAPRPGPWQRFVLAVWYPGGRRSDRDPLGERMRSAVLKDPAAAGREAAAGPTTVEEIEAAIKRADDKERLVGLLLAPVAAAIGLVVTASLIANDPSSRLADGLVNPKHVSTSLYTELGAVALVLALLMLVMAWYRKRLYLGIVMALYGLSIFNLHFWGFGIPYIIAGAWLLVRAYRLQQQLKLAKGGGGGTFPGSAGPNKRYTPPTRRPPKPTA